MQIARGDRLTGRASPSVATAFPRTVPAIWHAHAPIAVCPILADPNRNTSATKDYTIR